MKIREEIEKILRSFIYELSYKEESEYGCDEEDFISMNKELEALFKRKMEEMVGNEKHESWETCVYEDDCTCGLEIRNELRKQLLKTIKES
jgi:hypothetical protein